MITRAGDHIASIWSLPVRLDLPRMTVTDREKLHTQGRSPTRPPVFDEWRRTRAGRPPKWQRSGSCPVGLEPAGQKYAKLLPVPRMSRAALSSPIKWE